MEVQTIGISDPVKVKIPPMISSRNGRIAVFDSNPFYIKKKKKGKGYSTVSNPPSFQGNMKTTEKTSLTSMADCVHLEF